MHIERNYHDEAVKLWEEAERDNEERRARLTEAERAKELEQLDREAWDIIKTCEEKNRSTIRVVSPDRMDVFHDISQMALLMAQIGSLNVSITTAGQERPFGRIEFVTDVFMTGVAGTTNEPNYCSAGIKTILIQLINHSDDMTIDVKDGLLHMEFIFELCVEM